MPSAVPRLLLAFAISHCAGTKIKVFKTGSGQKVEVPNFEPEECDCTGFLKILPARVSRFLLCGASVDDCGTQKNLDVEKRLLAPSLLGKQYLNREVKDLTVSTAFYEALGFKRVHHVRPSGNWDKEVWFLAPNGGGLLLHLVVSLSSRHAARVRERFADFFADRERGENFFEDTALAVTTELYETQKHRLSQMWCDVGPKSRPDLVARLDCPLNPYCSGLEITANATPALDGAAAHRRLSANGPIGGSVDGGGNSCEGRPFERSVIIKEGLILEVEAGGAERQLFFPDPDGYVWQFAEVFADVI